jgi:hypothetical protein
MALGLVTVLLGREVRGGSLVLLLVVMGLMVDISHSGLEWWWKRRRYWGALDLG